MKSLKEYHQHDKQNFINEMNDFVSQETYRCAQKKYHYEDVKKIVEIESSLIKKMEFYSSTYVKDHIYTVIGNALDCIVQKWDRNNFIREMKDEITNKQFYAPEEYPWVLHKNKTDTRTEKKYPSAEELLGDILSVYDEYSDYEWSINFSYPPQLFTHENNYMDALMYLKNKEYLTTIEPDTEDMVFSCGTVLEAEDTNKIIVCQTAPFMLFPSAQRKIVDFDYEYVDVEIPQDAISKNLYSKDFEEKERTQQDLANLCELNGKLKSDTTQVCSVLNVSVDLTSPLSQKKLEEAIELIKMQIITVQSNNRDAAMLLAQDFKELNRAVNHTQLKHTHHIKLMEVFSSSDCNFENTNLKNLIVGLIIYKAYKLDPMEEKQENWICSKYKNNQINTICYDLSSHIKNTHGWIGFSEKSINDGYTKVSSLINKLYPQKKPEKSV